MNRFILCLLALIGFSAQAASPSFSSFNPNQFDTTGNIVSIKPGAIQTNSYSSNAFADNMTITNEIIIKGNAKASSVYVTNTLQVFNNTYTSNFYTFDGVVTNDLTVQGDIFLGGNQLKPFYTTDGTLTSDRTVDGDGNSLTFTNIPNFYLDVLGNIILGPTALTEYGPNENAVLQAVRFTGDGEPSSAEIFLESADSGDFLADAWTSLNVTTQSTNVASGTWFIKASTDDGQVKVQATLDNNAGAHTQQVRFEGTYGGEGFIFEPTIADGSTPYVFQSAIARTSGNLLDVQDETSASKFSVNHQGDVTARTYNITNVLTFALSDMTTALTTGTNKNYWYAPEAGMTIKWVRATLATASSSGTPTFDINEAGTSILSTKITIDADEWDSLNAATPPVISDSAIAAKAKVDFDIDVAGTAAAGAQIQIGYTVP